MPDTTRTVPTGRLFAAQVRYQLLLLVRTPRALVAGLLLPLVLLVLQGGRHDSRDAEAALVAGLAVLGVLSTAYLTHTAALVTARESGVLRRWRATPLPRWCFFAGRTTAMVLLAVAAATATAMAGAVLDGVNIHPAAAVGLLTTVVLGALAWSAIGTAVSAAIPTADSAQPLLALTFYPLVLLSGVFGPADDRPRWLSSLVSDLPVQPIVDAAARALHLSGTGTAAFTALSPHDLAVLTAWTVTALFAALCFFRWDPRRPPGRRAERKAS